MLLFVLSCRNKSVFFLSFGKTAFYRLKNVGRLDTDTTEPTSLNYAGTKGLSQSRYKSVISASWLLVLRRKVWDFFRLSLVFVLWSNNNEMENCVKVRFTSYIRVINTFQFQVQFVTGQRLVDYIQDRTRHLTQCYHTVQLADTI